MPESPPKKFAETAGELRLFVAAEIDDALREQIDVLAGKLKKGMLFTGAHPNWVEPGNWHFTLFFLGRTEADKAEKIRGALQTVRFDSFEIETGRLGVFPDQVRPSVLWLGLKQGKEQMIDLQGRIASALQPLGYRPDEKPFHPHLTLARIKSSKGVRGMLDIVSKHQEIFRGACRIGHFTLYRSELTPKGASYTPLAKIPAQITPVE